MNSEYVHSSHTQRARSPCICVTRLMKRLERSALPAQPRARHAVLPRTSALGLAKLGSVQEPEFIQLKESERGTAHKTKHTNKDGFGA